MTAGTLTRQKGSEFAPLIRRVKAAGLLERRRIRYAFGIGINLGAYAMTWLAIFAAGSWWALPLAVPAAVLTVQMGFFGHDACHQQIARTRG